MTLTQHAPSLLLLPPPPQPTTLATLNAAYRAPLASVLSRLSAESRPGATTAPGSPSASVLVVAAACPALEGRSPRSKSVRWKAAQSLLAGLYTLISSICEQDGIETATGDGGVDARIVLVDHDRGRTYQKNFDGIYEANNTAVLDLAGFASTVHPWRCLFHPSTEAGYELLQAYLKYAEGKQVFLQSQLIAVEGGISLSTKEAASDGEDGGAIRGYDTVCLGGTFDHLHLGHKLLLHATVLLLSLSAAEAGKPSTMIVGISGDELLKNKKYAEELESWDTRAYNVLSFLSTVLNTNSLPPTSTPLPDERHAVFGRGSVLVRCVNIHDPFGPTVSEENVDAIGLSGETRSGGQAINDKRAAQGWKPLDVYEIDVLDANASLDAVEAGSGGAAAESFATKISSTAIRKRRAEAK